MTDDLAQRAARHRLGNPESPHNWCSACAQRWPCSSAKAALVEIYTEVDRLAAALAAEQAARARERAALEWYADPVSWLPTQRGYENASAATADLGAIARAALAGEEVQ